MDSDTTFITDFVSDLPRGVQSVPMRRQTVPQARWTEPGLILKSSALAYDPDDPGDKILIGALGDKLVGIADNRHVLTVAGSRAGKSVTIIGNLLFYRGSVLCTDPKAELASITAARRAELGQKVHILDPFERSSDNVARFRSRYNPLAVLKPDSRTIIEDAELIADALVIKSGEEKDPHWNESAKHFIEGVILHVATAPEHEDRRTLVTVRDLIKLALMDLPDADDDDDPLKLLEDQMLANAARIRDELGDDDLAGAIEGAARDFYDKAENERSSVLSTVHRHTKFLDYKAMRAVLSGHDFELTDLKRHEAGITVYLCLPAGRMSSCSRWLRVFVNQLLDAVEREPTRCGAPPVLACLDEFPVLGFMQQMQDAIGQVASFDLRLWIIVQDWGQGKALYRDRWESFAANAGVLQAFGNSDLTTTEYLSKRLGKTLVEVTRVGEVGQEQREAGQSGRTQARELHDLLAPEEIRRVFARGDRLRRQLVIWADYHPMVLQRVEYWDEASPVHGAFAGKYASL